jgi:maltooligosyltrehalose trehalohydrolase
MPASIDHLFPEPPCFPQGAFLQPDGSVRWCLWAPLSKKVSLAIWRGGRRKLMPMTPAENGYFVCEKRGTELHSVPPDGLRYAYLLQNGQERPDPASRWQPQGVHKPSAVFDPAAFEWTDSAWRGAARDDLVIYELHVGTFTPEGSFAAIIPRLRQLAELGITAIELMPIAQFPGERNWGYDGVGLYAVQHSYGGPRELQRLVDAAHSAGLAVLLDVVYNHVGPEGNYLAEFGPYFAKRFHTPWGATFNYDEADCDPVRQFICDNARMWIRDFHLDGLRLDAIMMLHDLGARHILADIAAAAHDEAAKAGRVVHVIGETNQNDIRQVHSPERGGLGLDAVWADDLHHAMHALLTGERDGRFQDFGKPEHVAKAFNNVFVYDGCYSAWRRRRHGSPVGDAPRRAFVISIKNHDLIGNRPFGDRPIAYLPAAAMRMWCALSLLHPGVPLIFMGEEYGEQRPFPFFCSFSHERLIESVRHGRQRELSFEKLPGTAGLPDPQDPATFASAVLSWSWDAPLQAGLRQLYRDVLAARRNWPALRDREHTSARIVQGKTDTHDDAPLLIVQRGAGPSLWACASLNSACASLPQAEAAATSSLPQLLLSTEAKSYGGSRSPESPVESLLPYELIIYGQ